MIYTTMLFIKKNICVCLDSGHKSRGESKDFDSEGKHPRKGEDGLYYVVSQPQVRHTLLCTSIMSLVYKHVHLCFLIFTREALL